MYRLIALRLCWLSPFLAVVLSGCANVVVDGETKINTTPLWLQICIMGVCLIAAAICWFFRKKSLLTKIGIFAFPAFALFLIVAFSQLEGIVDADHFELRSIGNKFNVRFDELTRIEVVKEHTGVYRKTTEIVKYHVDLHKKNGQTQRIKLGDTMKPLWKYIVENAKKHNIVYEDNYGYLANPR
jgi:hypothetical protein